MASRESTLRLSDTVVLIAGGILPKPSKKQSQENAVTGIGADGELLDTTEVGDNQRCKTQSSRVRVSVSGFFSVLRLRWPQR